MEETDWLKKFSSSSVLKPAPDAKEDTLEVCEVLVELSSGEAFKKLVNISESEADFLVGVSLVGVSKKTNNVKEKIKKIRDREKIQQIPNPKRSVQCELVRDGFGLQDNGFGSG